MGSGAPSGVLHTPSSCSCARWSSGPVRRCGLTGGPPPRPPGSLPSPGGGAMGLSTGTRGSTCPRVTSGGPSHWPRMYHPHPALGFLRVPWAVTCQASSPPQGALPKLTLGAPPCAVTLMGRFSVLGVPGRAASSTARQLGGGGGRAPSPRLLSVADRLLRSELPVKRWAPVITALARSESRVHFRPERWHERPQTRRVGAGWAARGLVSTGSGGSGSHAHSPAGDRSPRT